MKKLILLSLCLVGCASAPLSEQEKSVRILRKSDAPADCKELGKVVTNPYKSLTDQDQDNELKRLAYALGGNTVTADKDDGTRALSGTSFLCK